MISEKRSVVPHAGTWIEINDEDLEWNRAIESFPTRERGLKLSNSTSRQILELSFPTRERGLKYREHLMSYVTDGRSPRGNVD